MKLDSRFQKRVKGMFERYSFEVGVLEDGPHYDAKIGKRGLKGADVITQYAGGPRRKVSSKTDQSISDVSASLREHLGFNYLSEPFKDRTSDIIKFSSEFLKMVFGRSQKKRVENLLQAIVRNPMLRGDYKGSESALTKRIKGFSRPTIDTAQLFKAIKATCIERSK
jgi:hypothetical protein